MLKVKKGGKIEALIQAKKTPFRGLIKTDKPNPNDVWCDDDFKSKEC